jgi:hypothetical protein
MLNSQLAVQHWLNYFNVTALAIGPSVPKCVLNTRRSFDPGGEFCLPDAHGKGPLFHVLTVPCTPNTVTNPQLQASADEPGQAKAARRQISMSTQ